MHTGGPLSVLRLSRAYCEYGAPFARLCCADSVLYSAFLFSLKKNYEIDIRIIIITLFLTEVVSHLRDTLVLYNVNYNALSRYRYHLIYQFKSP